MATSANSTAPGTTSITGPTSNTISSIISSLTSSSVPPTTTSAGTTSLPPTTTVPQTSVETLTPTAPGGTPSVVLFISTSTSANIITTDVGTQTNAPVAATTTTAAPLQSGSQDNHGPDAGVIAPAVVVPVVGIALAVLAGIWFFRRRRANKASEELRRKEVEEYGYNPNADGGVAEAAGGAGALTHGAAMSEADGSGYRGWGTTNSARKPSTTLGSTSVGAGAIGIARSDSGGNGGYRGNGQYSPNAQPVGAGHSDHNSGDPLMTSGSPSDNPDVEGVAALGSAPAAGSRSNTGVRRGPSNASSAYSAGQRSDTSGEGAHAMGSPGWDNNYPMEDGPYAGQGGAPVIRDVSARRNTRIESPSIMPQQARGGISQNF